MYWPVGGDTGKLRIDNKPLANSDYADNHHDDVY